MNLLIAGCGVSETARNEAASGNLPTPGRNVVRVCIVRRQKAGNGPSALLIENKTIGQAVAYRRRACGSGRECMDGNFVNSGTCVQ